MAVEERLFQFKTAGGAAEWFTELVGSVYPMVGSPVAKLSPVRDDGGAFVAVAPKYMVHGSHVGVGVALEGDLVITEIGYAQRPLASADVSQILQRAEESAGRGITRAVPAHFPNLA